MTVYEKFYKNDDSFMMKALAYYLSDDTDCDACPISEICKNSNDCSCSVIFYRWLKKEVKDA